MSHTDAICTAASYFLEPCRAGLLDIGSVMKVNKWAVHTDHPGEDGDNIYPATVVVNDPPSTADTTGSPGTPVDIYSTYTLLDKLLPYEDDGIPRQGWGLSFRRWRFQEYPTEIDGTCVWCGSFHPPLYVASWVGWWLGEGTMMAASPIGDYNEWEFVFIAGDTRVNRLLEFGRTYLTILDEACDPGIVHGEATNGVGYWTLVAKEEMLTYLCGGTKADFSLHTDCPGLLGDENEYEGVSDWGAYQRRPATFDTALAEEWDEDLLEDVTVPKLKLSISVLFRGARDDQVTWLGIWKGGVFHGAINLQEWNEETQAWEGGPTFGEETCLLKIMKEVTYLEITELPEAV